MNKYNEHNIDWPVMSECMTESVLITDATLDEPGPFIIYVNPAFEKMTGWTKEEILGIKLLKVLSEVEYYDYSLKYGEIFEAGTGAETLRKIFEKTDLTDYDSLIKLKNVAKDGALEGNMDFLSFEVIGRLLPEGLDKVLYGLVIGIPVVVAGNRNVVETMTQSLRFLSPTKLLKVKLWSHNYEKGFDIIGTNDFKGLIPSHNLIIANLDDGIVYGGLSSQYFQDIATQLPGLNAMEAYSLVRSELDWIFKALESLSIRAHSKDSLPLEKQMILLKLLEKLHG